MGTFSIGTSIASRFPAIDPPREPRFDEIEPLENTAAVYSGAALSRQSLLVHPDVPVKIGKPFEPPALGHSPHDHVLVRSSPALAHIGRAMSGPDRTVQSIFDDGVVFSRPPDPTPELLATHDANRDLHLRGGGELSVTTYNVAWLDIEVTLQDAVLQIPLLNLFYVLAFPLLFWFRFIKVLDLESPHLKERRERLPQEIFTAGDDVVMVQEVWRREDLLWLAKRAHAFGYVAVASPRPNHTDGLMTFIKRSSMVTERGLTLTSKAYTDSDWKEAFVGVERGYHRVDFEHPTLGPISVINTHMQPFPEAWRIRMREAREIGLAVRDVTKRNPNAVVVLGGDLNAGPYYREDRWEGDGKRTDDLYNNTLSYALLGHYSGMSDLAVAGRPREEAAADVTLAEPGKRLGTHPTYPFTADGVSNGVYRRQYGRTEPPHRLDHLWGNTASGRIKVLRSELAYSRDLPIGAGAKKIELSDHYGVRTRLQIAPPVTKGRRYSTGALPVPKASGRVAPQSSSVH